MLDNKDLAPLQISDISRHAGVSASTIRVWEQQDLLRPTYTESGRRTYREADLQIALAIKRMRTVEGMKIAEITRRSLASLSLSTEPSGTLTRTLSFL